MANYARSSQWIHKRVFEDDESLLIPLMGSSADLSSVLILNDTGSFLWEQLADPGSLTDVELARRIEDEFDFGSGEERSAVQAEVEHYLSALVELGAVLRVD